MPKSKEYISTSESGSDSDEETKKKTKKSKEKKSKRPASDSDEEVEEPKKKAKKPSKPASEDEKEEKLEIGKMRFVSVSEFKGKAYINIREYYEKDGKELPGRKGISLNKDQWKKLKQHMDEIDERLKDF